MHFAQMNVFTESLSALITPPLMHQIIANSIPRDPRDAYSSRQRSRSFHDVITNGFWYFFERTKIG